jgi:hypothetical protein
MVGALGDVVGRGRELAEVAAFLTAIPDGPRALLIDGEAGIGKTTVWLDAVRNAEDRGYRVLRARPAESESRLSYAALADIVGPAFEEVGSALPEPQERALATVMLRVATAGPADARTTATALVGVLAALAGELPVLLAIDDAQWLDDASARALEFAVRRLPARLGVLATVRTGAVSGVVLGLDRALPESRFGRVVVGPLSMAALRHVISARFQRSVARPVLARFGSAIRCSRLRCPGSCPTPDGAHCIGAWPVSSPMRRSGRGIFTSQLSIPTRRRRPSSRRVHVRRCCVGRTTRRRSCSKRRAA